MAEQSGICTAAERRRELVERGDDSAERYARLHFGAGASPRGAQAAEGASGETSPSRGHLYVQQSMDPWMAGEEIPPNPLPISVWTFDGPSDCYECRLCRVRLTRQSVDGGA